VNAINKMLLLVMMSVLAGCASNIKINKEMTSREKFEVCKQMIEKRKFFQATTELSKLRYEMMGTDIIDQVIYALAEAYRLNKDYPEALVNYQVISKDYPNSPLAIIAQFKTGICYQALSQKAELDQEYTDKAIQTFQDLIESNSQSEYEDSSRYQLKKLNNKLAEKDFKNGLLYYKINQYKSAEIYFKEVILNYFESDWVDSAFYYLALTYLKLDKKDDAEVLLQRLIHEFKQSQYLKKAEIQLQKIAAEKNKSS